MSHNASRTVEDQHACVRCGLPATAAARYPGCRADNFRSECRYPGFAYSSAYGHFSGSEVAAIVGTVALVPFVQAAVGALGTRLADVIDTKTRKLVRGFLEGQARGRGRRVEAREGTFGILVTPHASQAQVRITSDLPAEALAQLITLKFQELTDPQNAQVTVRWVGDQWLASSLQDGRIIDRSWQPGTGTWSDFEAAPNHESRPMADPHS